MDNVKIFKIIRIWSRAVHGAGNSSNAEGYKSAMFPL
jgi:hypothetical protein